MNKLIIFDFNRTLYDPTVGKLFPHALDLLSTASAKGYRLVLVSRLEPGRSDVLELLGIKKYFQSIHFVHEKTRKLFEEILSTNTADPKSSYSVGDHLYSEVRHGNQCGMKTVWVRCGAFSSLRPESKDDEPWRTVSELKEVIDLLE